MVMEREAGIVGDMDQLVTDTNSAKLGRIQAIDIEKDSGDANRSKGERIGSDIAALKYIVMKLSKQDWVVVLERGSFRVIALENDAGLRVNSFEE